MGSVFDWDGGSGSFSDPSQWNSGLTGAPGASDEADIDNSGTITGSGSVMSMQIFTTVTFQGGAVTVGSSGLTLRGSVDLTIGSGSTFDTTAHGISGFTTGDVEIDVTAGGTLKAGDAQIGSESAGGATDTVTVTGGVWDGSLTLGGTDAGVLQVTGSTFDGGAALSNTTATVSGTTWTGGLTVGNGGLASTFNATGSTFDMNAIFGVVSGSTANISGGSLNATIISSGGTVDLDDVTTTLSPTEDVFSLGSLVGLWVQGGKFTVTGGELTDSGTALLEGSTAISGGAKVELGDLQILGGALTVDGKGGISTLTADDTVITDFGTGTGQASATVSAGGHFNVAELTAGDNKGTADTLTVTGAGSVLDATGDMTLGESGRGDFQFGAAADVTASKDVEQASKTGGASTGTVGGGAKWAIHGNWTVGGAGTATDTVNGGATTTVGGTMEIGGEAGGIGSLALTGKGTSVTAAGAVTIGGQGTGQGTLTVKSGALFDASGSAVTLGEASQSKGTLTVSGDGSEVETGKLTVAGASRHGAATVSAGGTLTVETALALGEEKGSSGTLGVSGAASTLAVGGAATIGGSGSGKLTLTQGTLTLGGAVTLGEAKGAKGTLAAHGGTVSLGGELTVGAAGNGALTLNQGAAFSGAGGHLGSLTLGEKTGGNGTVTLDGSATMSLKELTDGAAGKGTATVEGGAALSASTVDIGTRTGTAANNNTLTVDTAGVLSVAADLAVGKKGLGTLTVKGAGKASVGAEVAIGEGANAIGAATITGTAANATTHKAIASTLDYGALVVGEAGSGTLTVSAGGHAAVVKGGAGTVEIAADTGATGEVTVTGKGSAFTGKSLAVGGTAEKAGGTGSLTVAAAATVTFAKASIWQHGAVALNGGTLHVTGAIEGNGAITIGKSGTLLLGGHDETVGVSFAAAGHGVLSLGAAGLLEAAIKGFAKTDSIKIGGLDAHATISVAAKGADTVVTVNDDGKAVGDLTLAGHYTAAALHFATTTGTLTTTAAASAQTGAEAPAAGTAHLHAAAAAEAIDSGAGTDTFVFDTKPIAANADTIENFTPGTGHIVLDPAAFAGIGAAGPLAAAYFVADPHGVAHTAAQHIVYDTTTGALSYDPDGSGGEAAIHFATLAGHPHLVAADFLVA
ncbi:MAG TPA: hypothetical protein VHD15_16100 [Hyphomicrobiales bacterium]|nr:hypothetical protein [Hyphomicrobiales bacterium]